MSTVQSGTSLHRPVRDPSPPSGRGPVWSGSRLVRDPSPPCGRGPISTVQSGTHLRRAVRVRSGTRLCRVGQGPVSAVRSGTRLCHPVGDPSPPSRRGPVSAVLVRDPSPPSGWGPVWLGTRLIPGLILTSSHVRPPPPPAPNRKHPRVDGGRRMPWHR